MKSKDMYFAPSCEYYATVPERMIATSAPNLPYGDPFLN